MLTYFQISILAGRYRTLPELEKAETYFEKVFGSLPSNAPKSIAPSTVIIKPPHFVSPSETTQRRPTILPGNVVPQNFSSMRGNAAAPPGAHPIPASVTEKPVDMPSIPQKTQVPQTPKRSLNRFTNSKQLDAAIADSCAQLCSLLGNNSMKNGIQASDALLFLFEHGGGNPSQLRTNNNHTTIFKRWWCPTTKKDPQADLENDWKKSLKRKFEDDSSLNVASEELLYCGTDIPLRKSPKISVMQFSEQRQYYDFMGSLKQSQDTTQEQDTCPNNRTKIKSEGLTHLDNEFKIVNFPWDSKLSITPEIVPNQDISHLRVLQRRKDEIEDEIKQLKPPYQITFLSKFEDSDVILECKFGLSFRKSMGSI